MLLYVKRDNNLMSEYTTHTSATVRSGRFISLLTLSCPVEDLSCNQVLLGGHDPRLS